MSGVASSVVRADRMLPVIVAALVAGVAIWAAHPYAVGVFHDDGVYVILGKSLATGQGYRFLHLPGAPPATHYPPAYPLLLAFLWKLAPSFPENVSAFLITNALLLGVTAIGVERFGHAVLGWSRPAAVVAALVATLSTPLLMLSSLVLSEPLFAALLLPALIAAERVARGDASTRYTVAVAIALGGLALVRTHALALVVALVLILLIRRRWKAAVVSAMVAGLTIAPWQLWLAAHATTVNGPLAGSYGPYGAWLANGARGGGLSFLIQTMLVNAREVGALLADHFALGDDSLARNCAAGLSVALLSVGAWRASRRAPVLVAFACVYLLVLLVWPFTPWRFVFAIWPLVVLFIGEAVALAVDARSDVWRGAPRLAIAAGVALIAIGGLREESRAYVRRSWRQPGADAAAQIAPLVRWVSARTSTTDVVAVDGEQLVYLFTGRRAVPVAPFTAAEYVRPRTESENAESLRALIEDYPVNYVATISPSLRASGEMVTRDSLPRSGATRPVRLIPISALAGGEVFRVDRATR